MISAVSLPGMAEVYSGEVKLYRREPPTRACVVYGAEVVPDDARAQRRVLEAPFDLCNEAVVPAPVGLDTWTDLPATAAEILDYRGTRVTLRPRSSG